MMRMVCAFLLLISTGVGCGPSAPGPAANPPVPTADAPAEKKATDDPHHYLVKFETTAGNFTVAVAPSWAPLGAARFRELVEAGFYDGCRFFRVAPGFVVQFGINGDPEVSKKWSNANINDDPVVASNTRGKITFATSGPNSRTTQVFINYDDNSRLDAMGFAPFGDVVEGMDVVGSIDATYREAPSQHQKAIEEQGNAFLSEKYPNLDSVEKATIVGSPAAEQPQPQSAPAGQDENASP
jgi:peptidyl-prolyl cis-trans isomerase A (cyclophilin A)